MSEHVGRTAGALTGAPEAFVLKASPGHPTVTIFKVWLCPRELLSCALH